MSSIYHERDWEDEPTLEEKIKYYFICAASALSIMDRCRYCEHLRAAIKELDEREVKRNENKMD